MCFPLKPAVSMMSDLDASPLTSGHMTHFFYGFLDNRGGTTYPPAQLTPLSPIPLPKSSKYTFSALFSTKMF